MKYPIAIFTAAAAAVVALVRALAGDSGTDASQPNPDAASAIPPMTEKAIESLAYSGATDADIADRFLADPSDIAVHFKDVLKVARAHRRMMLRGLQTEAARKLNASMLTWLGKNELGQSTSPAALDEPLPEITDAS